MGRTIEVLLVVTNPPGLRGSMARFADLVEIALKTTSNVSVQVTVFRMNLALPYCLTFWLSESIQTWLNHLWLVLFARWRIGRSGANLVHLLDGSYAYILKGFTRIPAIATVHDLIPLIHQDGRFGKGRSSVFARKIIRDAQLGLRNCVHLLADSANTAQDLNTFQVADRENVTVVPLALDPSLTALSVSSQERANQECMELDTHREPTYILHLGNNGYYKNREGVLRIYAEVRQQYKVRLVMAGPAPTNTVKNLLKYLSLEDCVDFELEPDDLKLMGLYRNASLFLFPSLYEGFGWPPLEAMACGCPVVCSSEASLPEVVGDAALTAPADDESQLSALCLAVLTDRVLANALVMKGLKRSRQYTTQRMGRELLASYEHILESQEVLRDQA